MEWNNKISENVQAVPFSGIRKFFDLASTMKDVISRTSSTPCVLLICFFNSSASLSLPSKITITVAADLKSTQGQNILDKDFKNAATVMVILFD